MDILDSWSDALHVLHADNVLGVYNKYSPLKKFDPEFKHTMLGKYLSVAQEGWSFRLDDLA